MNDILLNEIKDLDQNFSIKKFLKNKGIEIVLKNNEMISIINYSDIFNNLKTKIIINISENVYNIDINQSSISFHFSFEYDELEKFFYLLKKEKKEINLFSNDCGIIIFSFLNQIKDENVLYIYNNYDNNITEINYLTGFDIVYSILLFSKILMYSNKNIDLFEETVKYFLN